MPSKTKSLPFSELPALVDMLAKARAAAKKKSGAREGAVYAPPYLDFARREVFTGKKGVWAVELSLAGESISITVKSFVDRRKK